MLESSSCSARIAGTPFSADALRPGSIRKPFPHTKLLNSFRCMENIQTFCEVAENQFMVPRSSLFQTCDLYAFAVGQNAK